MEAVGTENQFLKNNVFQREFAEQTKFRTVSPQGFACYISSGILTDMIQTVLETSECFLSKSMNNMHKRVVMCLLLRSGFRLATIP